MEDYPPTLMELEQRLSTEQACRDYLFSLRWPEGFVCPRCGGREVWPMKRALRQCAACRYQASVTAGTIFQDSRVPLTLWFRAMWLVASQNNGVSAMGIQRVLGLGSYKTAWAMLHKLRRAMVRPGRDRLAGTVEVDETYWGAQGEGVVGRLTEDKALVIVAAQEDGPKKIGRIRMRRIPDLTRPTLHGFICQNIEPVISDN
jgi:transposase-like protein